MHIAVAVAWHEDIFLAHDAVLHHLLFHKLRHALLDEHLAGTRERIDRIESHIVLMAVHRIDNQTVAVWRSLDARIIAVCIYRNIKADGLASLQIITPEAHLGIVLTRLRILVGILAWIIVELRMCRLGTLEKLERVSLHMRLIEADPADGSTVSIPCKRPIESKFLLVNPVRNSVDDFIKLAIGSNLRFLFAIKDKEIIILYESDVLGIRRPCSHLLVFAFRKFAELLAGDIVDEILGLERSAVHSLALGDYQELLAVRAHHISINRLERSLSLMNIKEDSHLLARLEGIADNLLAVITDRSIQISTFDRIDSRHITGREFARSNALQIQFLCSFHCRYHHDSCNKNRKFLHSFLYIKSFNIICLFFLFEICHPFSLADFSFLPSPSSFLISHF